MSLRTTISTALLLVTIGAVTHAQEKTETRIAPKADKRFESHVFFLNSGGYLGTRLTDVDADKAKELRLKEERGAIISEVVDGSPAATAGLKKNDVVIQWNDTRVESVAQLVRLVSETPAGRTVKIGLIRNGVESKLDVKIGERKPDFGNFHFEMNPEAMKDVEKLFKENAPQGLWKQGHDTAIFRTFFPGRPRLGVFMQGMSESLAKYFGVADGKGALVADVQKDSPAEKSGITAGDVILAVDGQKVANGCDLQRIIGAKEEGTVDLTILRDKKEQHVKVTLPKREQSGIEGLQQTLPDVFKNLPEGSELHQLPSPEMDIH